MKARLGIVSKAVGVVTLLAMAGSAVISIFPGWNNVGVWLSRESAPAWVQAVGSVIAIFASAGIALYQVDRAWRLQEENRKAGDIQRLSIITSLLVRSHGLVNDVVKAVREPSEYNFSVIDTPLMRDTVEALRAIPLFEIPSGMAALDVRSTARHLTLLADRWDTIRETVNTGGNPPSQEDQTELVSFCNELMEVTKEALDACKAGIHARGGVWS